MSTSSDNPIVLYDGVCGLCNRLVQVILKRDVHDRFRFASLQSEFAETLLKRHDADSRDLDTFYVVINYGEASERVLMRSDAILHVVKTLGESGVWRGPDASCPELSGTRCIAWLLVIVTEFSESTSRACCRPPNIAPSS